MIRFAKASWQGTGKEGKGNLTTQSTALNDAPYSYNARFAEASGTNPEELIAAAHAGCFTMKLTFNITAAGFTANTIETKCEITLESGLITQSNLIVNAHVPGISAGKFEEIVVDTKTNCTVSKLLNCKITHKAAVA